MKRINEQDGNAPGGSRFGDFSTRIMLGGVVLDTDAVDFEAIVRFRYRVRRIGLAWGLQRLDKRDNRMTLVAWYWTRRGAQSAAWLANRCSDLATEEGWL